MLRKIDCVMVRVDNLDAAVAYYQEVFGLRVRWRNGLQVGLGMPETDAEIVLHSEPDLPPGTHVYYLVDNVISAAEQLAARDCTIVVAPLDIRIGKCAVVTDPFGNTVNILDMTRGPLPEGFGLVGERAGDVRDE